MPAMGRLFVVLVVVLAAGCGTLPALKAVKDGRIKLEVDERAVVGAAGPPNLILASQGVETLYYKRSDELAVSVSLLKGKVVAFDDRDKWPLEAWKAADDAKRPVSTGKVRVGMAEAAVIAALDEKPNGITARDGIETMHWLTGEEVDSQVILREGKVEGFLDRPISEFTQNLPTHDRDKSTTSGRVRVGMTVADVEKRLGAPDSLAGKDGVSYHRYESDPLFGDTILYAVGFKGGRVVELSELNETREKERKKKEAEAAAAEKRAEEAESSIFGFLSNPLVQAAIGVAAGAALGGAMGGAKGGGSGSKYNYSSTTAQSTSDRSLIINGTRYTGGASLGQQCSIRSGCPAGYKCVIFAGDSGMCAQ